MKNQLIKSATKIAKRLIKERTFDGEKVLYALRINFPSLSSFELHTIMAKV